MVRIREKSYFSISTDKRENFMLREVGVFFNTETVVVILRLVCDLILNL